MSEPRKDDATDDTGAGAAESTPSTAETPAAAAPTPATPTPATPAAATPESPVAATPETPAIAPTSPIAAEAPTAATPDTPTPAPAAPAPAATPAPAAAPAASVSRKGVLIGAGALVALIAVLAVGAFVWPGFLAGPGKPDDTAAAAVASLGSKDPAAVDKVSCHDPDGKSLGQLSPEAMQLIQGAKSAGPATLVLDTQAQMPIDLTLSAQGQTQNIPASLVFAVDDGKWCMAGLSMRR
jgi:hypothetical protein